MTIVDLMQRKITDPETIYGELVDLWLIHFLDLVTPKNLLAKTTPEERQTLFTELAPIKSEVKALARLGGDFRTKSEFILGRFKLFEDEIKNREAEAIKQREAGKKEEPITWFDVRNWAVKYILKPILEQIKPVAPDAAAKLEALIESK